MFRSGGVIGSGDSIRVLVLSVCGGTRGTGGTRERAPVVSVRRRLGVVGCRVLSRAVPPEVAVTRVVAEVVCREDTDAACDEGRTRDAGDDAGEIDTFVRCCGTAVAGLFVTLFGAEVVRARGPMRDVVTLLGFVSDISVQRVDPDKVRLRPELSGTDRVVEDDGFDRRETREGGFLIGIVGDGVGVVLLFVARLLFLAAGLAASVAARRDSAMAHLRNI